MTPAVLLLIYLCAPADEGSHRLSCVAREVQHESCAVALAMAEASIPPGRLWHPVTCMALGPTHSPAAAPRPQQRTPR